MARTNPDFMNGVPELLVLALLREREMYGYELVQTVGARTSHAISLGEGVIYPVLHALEADGALLSRRKSIQGRSRIYYALTPAGLDRLNRLAGSWATLAAAIQRLLPHPAPGGTDVFARA